MAVPVTNGNLELRYRHAPVEWLCWAVSVLALALGIPLCLRPRGPARGGPSTEGTD